VKHATLYDSYDEDDKQKKQVSYDSTICQLHHQDSGPGSQNIYTARSSVPFFLHWLFSNHAHRLQILLINNTSGKNPKTEDRILRAQRNMVVHLVLTALGAVAVETQGLVGHQLLGARVDGSTNGNTKL
jgi:hypothetical protein